MRVGESLREMDDAEYFSVISEQDPDFSSRVCKGLTLNDLDAEAIENMRHLIADKQKRPDATTVPLNQILKDLLKYATLLLLGKSEAINRYLLYKPHVRTIAQRYDISHIQTVYNVIRRNGEASMSDFVEAFDSILTQKQVRTLIEGLCKTPLISSHGNARATRYHWV